MANQFDAKVRFDACAWTAYHPETGANCIVIDHGRRVEWSVRANGERYTGTSTTPTGARAACRRVIARLEKK